MAKYRWIMYLHTPFPGAISELERVESLSSARQVLRDFCRDTGFHYDLQVNGEYGCSAVLYVYSELAWAEAKEYEEIGCPFDYPDKRMSRGPRGGVVTENA